MFCRVSLLTVEYFYLKKIMCEPEREERERGKERRVRREREGEKREERETIEEREDRHNVFMCEVDK